jgi:hypothetical protein
MPVGRLLNEREVGFDANSIGFPSIGACMGVVLQTANGLYGFHAMPGDVDRVAGYDLFIQRHALTGAGVHLYGSCIRSKRCSGDLAQWRAEMTTIANALNYHGPVGGFDLPAYPDNKDKTTDTTYVEYRRDATTSTCEIYYKRMSKMTVTSGTNPTVDPTQRLTRRAAGPVIENPIGNNVALTADIVATYWNKGELHKVPNSKIDTFDIP